MDGTLIRSDLLLESAALLLRDKPWLAFAFPIWVLQGRAALKRRIADRVELAADTLPYNSEVIEWLHEEKAKGRPLILATAAETHLASAVADHVGLFDYVVASDGVLNLKGHKKLDALQARYGPNFDYAGDSGADLPIWRTCREAILVNPSSRTLRAARKTARVGRVFETPRRTGRLILRELRVYQWVKNLLIFVPLITSHQLGRLDLVYKAVLAFAAFSLLASSVYIVNDVADLESDRRHARKRLRPFASGNLSLKFAFALAPILVVAAFAISALLPVSASAVLGIYFVATLLYSLWLKRKLLVDVFMLAGLYTLRIVMGQASYGVELSTWLISFSIFLFLSLGFCKRASELYNMRESGRTSNPRRGYNVDDLPQVNVFGVATGCLSSLVLAEYMNSDNVRILYKQPELLWLLSPLMLYWISRIWIVTYRGKMTEDPILFAAKDRVTLLVALVFVAILFAATRNWFHL